MALWEYTSFIKWLVFLNIFLSNCVPTNFLKIQDLRGVWDVQNLKRGYNLPASVPGGVYSDLMKNKIIDDVFFKSNDINTRWVSKINWNYTRTFTVSEVLLSHSNINLVFDGIDTFARIKINDKHVGVTENMFVRYIFDVESYLQPGTNTIEVQFISPVRAARLIFEKQAHKYVVPPLCVPEEYHGECHVNHIRKMQASFAWDWGPAFPSMGIWKPVYLEAYNSSVLRDVTVEIRSDTAGDHWDITVNVYLAKNYNKDFIQGTVIFRLYTDIEKLTNIYRINITKNVEGDFVFTQTISISKSYVKLWWPNGYGEPNLYILKVSYMDVNKNEKSSKILKVGFRTVELVQNAIQSGRTFYFKINDVPLFAKGSNVIPISILPELGQNETTIRFLLQSAKDVHMNMLRVWGGGVYESDVLYQTADEMGLMLWQDFMFACSMYPSGEAFLSSIRTEVRHQVRRLQYHPSIVLWASNNENEAALRGDWYNTNWNFTLFHEDYVKLYVDTIRDEVLLNDKTRPFLTSSPTNGIESDAEDYVASDPGSNFYGDVHFYNYLFDGWSTLTYPVNRFASEFGYQSLPSTDTLFTATDDPDDLSTNSAFLLNRQHHSSGYEEMQVLIEYQLNLPSRNNTHYNRIFAYYSQIIQAMSVKIETEYYRQWRSNLNNVGEGLTMGALYWQLNDVWVAPSWSSIDFKNNWKMIHYYAKKFFAPVIVKGDKDISNNVHIYVVSDLLKPVRNSVLDIIMFTWDSFLPLSQRTLKIDVLPGFSQRITTVSTFASVSNTNEPCGNLQATDCFLYFTLKDDNNETVAPDNFVFPVPLKLVKLQKPTVKIIDVRQADSASKVFEIEIQTDRIALFVWLSVKNIRGLFSDNGFLQVTPTKMIYFYAEETTPMISIKSSLAVTNLLGDDGI
ncbi:hypothetical protein ILUMI_04960 [Ignelater luminosus]|uniref:Beta-mannosidase B n=1 Tax=Ignelater luminosus TaxID=2038154 RepID=A0A8K0D8N0_IGNLU|nr:hypothetical protein ILUMI_04960 [Ignelater luminosus]